MADTKHYKVTSVAFGLPIDATFRSSKTDTQTLQVLAYRAVRNTFKIDTSLNDVRITLPDNRIRIFETYEEFFKEFTRDEWRIYNNSRKDWISPCIINKYLDRNIQIILVDVISEIPISSEWRTKVTDNCAVLRSRRANTTYLYLGEFTGVDSILYVVLVSKNGQRVVVPFDEFKEVYFIEEGSYT